ncbi:MAG: hypothetical protein Q8K74_03370 [Candidatus Nitrotoga sp.]|nr:hypothetical protein [Candidatus Nitrotoga sp.]MDP1855077.1 hypothetical protein [Candidatus Nitrotoga sp.]
MDTFKNRAAWATKIRDAVHSGTIATASRTTLTEYSTWLCNPLANSTFSGGGEYEQICELVRLHMLRAMIDAFEERSKIMQRWLLLFAILAIAATLLPYFIAPNPINSTKQLTTESISKTGKVPSPPQAQSMETPSIQAKPPTLHSSGTPQKRGAS